MMVTELMGWELKAVLVLDALWWKQAFQEIIWMIN